MTSSSPDRPSLLGRVRETCRLRQLSRRTEQAYLAWVRRFARFRHPAELGEAEVLALSALVFLYRAVLGRPLGEDPGP
jgi:hypothetical protein